MQVSFDGIGLTIGEAKHSWQSIKKIVLEDLPNNNTGVYVFGNSLLNSFSMDNSKVDFLKQLAVAARKNNTEVVAVPKNMIMCPTCGTLVAENAMNCPSCGHVFQKQKSGGLGFFGTVFAIIVAVAIMGLIG